MVRLGMAIRKHYKGAKVSGKKQKKERGDEVDGKRRDREQLSFAEVENWEIPPISSNSVEIGSLPSPIWTETKAQLIQNYLRLFLFITKHGVYIDGFAGPQDKANPDSWAAKLVLELAPPWMKAFFLCEIKKSSYADILSMLQTQKTIAGRQIVHKHGDFNEWIADVLASGSITDKTATFALLDQRSTECHWSGHLHHHPQHLLSERGGAAGEHQLLAVRLPHRGMLADDGDAAASHQHPARARLALQSALCRTNTGSGAAARAGPVDFISALRRAALAHTGRRTCRRLGLERLHEPGRHRSTRAVGRGRVPRALRRGCPTAAGTLLARTRAAQFRRTHLAARLFAAAGRAAPATAGAGV